MEREQAVRLTQNLLRKMVEREGSDLFLTAAFPPAIKVDGTIHKATDTPLSPDQAAMMVRSIMNDKQIKEFDATKECNFAIAPQGIGRFRVSAFIQQGMVGAVLRTITTEIPTLEDLELPPILKDVVMNKRGLCIIVGGTGSGKSTTLAAMIGHRNENSAKSVSIQKHGMRHSRTPCDRHRMSSSSVRSATRRPWNTASSFRRRVTFALQPCTQTARTRRWTALSTSSRKNGASSC
jgi:type II secretory ATPase GspE/PulE/Tfp pilus assembly ATPase PilB-like protein